MKRYSKYIFLVFCLLTLFVFLTKSRNDKYITTSKNIEDISNQKDSLFELADEILEISLKEKEINDSIINNLDLKIKNKELTIDQQYSQINKMKKEKKKNVVIEPPIVSSSNNFDYEFLLIENFKMEMEINELKFIIDSLNNKLNNE